MAGNIVNLSDPLLIFLQESILGFNDISLTYFTTSSEPTIYAGSKLEVGQSIYEFSTDESITGWAGISTGVFAYVKTSTTTATSQITASWTTATPVWSDSKQAYYDSLEVNRFIAGCYKGSSTSWDIKFIIKDRGLFLGEQNNSLTYNYPVSFTKGRILQPENTIVTSISGTYQQDDVYLVLANCCDSTSKKIQVNGGFSRSDASTDLCYLPLYAERQTSTSIDLTCLTISAASAVAPAIATVTITSSTASSSLYLDTIGLVI